MNKLTKIIRAGVLAHLLAICPVTAINANEKEYVGVVSMVENIVSTGLGEKASVLKTGDRVFSHQKIKTLMNSRVQLIFLDQSVINLGPDSELSIKKFNLSERSSDSYFSADIVKGLVRIKSGAMPIGSYAATSPNAQVTLQGTEIDLLVTQEGATEVLLRRGAASVSAIATMSSTTPEDVGNINRKVLLSKPDTYIQLTKKKGPTIPQLASAGKRNLYQKELELKGGDNAALTVLDRNRVKAELELAGLGDNRPITEEKITSEFLLRSLDRSKKLTIFLNEKIRTCQGQRCNVLLNKRRLINRAIRKLGLQSAALLGDASEASKNIRGLLAQAIAEAQNLKVIATNAQTAVQDARQSQKTAQRSLKKKKASVKFKSKRKAVKKAKSALRKLNKDKDATPQQKKAAQTKLANAQKRFADAKTAIKPANQAFREAKNKTKQLQAAAKDAIEASNKATAYAESIQAQVKTRKLHKKLKRVKRSVGLTAATTSGKSLSKSRHSTLSPLPSSIKETKAGGTKVQAAAKSVATKAKAANRKAKAAAKKAATQAKSASKKAKAAAKKAAKQAKAATKKAKKASKKAAKQAKAARKAARRAAARARKAALRKAKREAAEN